MFKIDVRRCAILDDSLPQLAGAEVDTSRMQEHLNIGFIGEPALDAGGRWFLKQITNLAVPYTESMFKIDVRRCAILDDSLPQLAGAEVDTSRMQEHLNIGFIGEPALDAGGVLREWFGLVCKELFSAERGLFVTTHAEDSSYWINSESAKCVPEGHDHLQYFTFAGRLLGKAILDGLVLEVSMALPLLKHLLGVPITFSDLEFLDEELFKHLSWVRDNDHVDALCVTFSIQTPSGETVELKPGGDDIDVTDENKMEYLSLVLRYRMLDSVADQLTALLKGLYEVIPKALLTIFDYQELDFYLSGLPTLNVTDWQNNSRVRHAAQDDDSEGIEQELEVVQWFWDVVGSFTDDQRARLLQFATGCSRVPVEGFRALTSASGIVHPFTLQLVPIGTPPLGMCPRAHTCFNRIDLPIYETKEDLNSYLSLVRIRETFTKRTTKKSNDATQSDDGGSSEAPETITERPNQNADVSRQSSSGPTVDLSFFRTSGQLYGELHQCLSRVNAEDFTEASVSQTGRRVLTALDDLAEAADPRSDTRNPCPFVMLLSMLLPTLRKYLAWTQATRSVWGSNFIALRHQSTTSEGTIYRGESDMVLWAMIAQHDILTRLSLQSAHILRLIESSEGVDHETTHPKRNTRQSKAPKSTSQASSGSSSCSSVASTPRDPMETGTVRTPRVNRDKPYCVPQIHHISMELAHIDAECKVHLADLTESLVDVVEMVRLLSNFVLRCNSYPAHANYYFVVGNAQIAKHMCTPTASKDAGRSRISALQAAPFEAAVMHLRTWSFKLVIEYNTLVRSLSNSSNNTDSSTDTDSNEAVNITHVPNNRLDLMTLGGFRRLETTLSSWLNAASSTTGTGPDPGSGTSSRSWGVTSLAGGIRSTLVRTFSGRATISGPPV
ncbi:unnamed protein product [Phytophthora lilii]|uniref:HECT-type E3 ubiquitin transferase n=1 Tax=Phytophthora lilii TaxID=2077276 RepID=A0A9W6TCM1_9STRA|nr:unnamed protein product [Phytophthora lilii]